MTTMTKTRGAAAATPPRPTTTAKALLTAGALIAVVALSACSPTAAIEQATGSQECDPGPEVAIIIDVSESTAQRRQLGGPVEQAATDALAWTAQHCGAAYVTTADGAAIANGQWIIDAETFETQIALDGELGAAARRRQALGLRDEIRGALATSPAAGSDLLGALTRLPDAISQRDGRDRVAVLITDGALVVKGHYSTYKTPLNTERRREKFLTRLERGGEVPDLSGWTIHIAGLGVGINNRETARWVRRFWIDQLIPATGATRGTTGAHLRLPDRQ